MPVSAWPSPRFPLGVGREAASDDCDGGCDDPDNPDAPAEREWWCPRYRNRGDLCDFLGDTQPLLIEVFAVRVAQMINSCRTLDWCYEHWTTTFLRETAPGFRVGYFVVCLIVVVVYSFILDDPLVLRYSLTMDTLETRWADTTLSVALYMWTIDLALLCQSYYLVKHSGGETFAGSVVDFIPFRAAPPARLREDRERRDVTLHTVCGRFMHALFYIAYFVLGVLSTHTLLAHTYQKRNPYFAALLVLQCVLALFASVADLTFIGSPWGIQEASKTASVLLSTRGLLLVPLAIIWTGVALAASFPPSYCRDC